MKLRIILLVGVAIGGTLVPRLSAQTLGGLDVHIYAGLSVTGTVGTVYSIEYVPDVAQTNTPGTWRCLEFLQLPTSPYLWTDKSAPATGRRFYRAVAFAAPTHMVFIPPGAFRMGSPSNEVDRFYSEGPQTSVTLSRGFWIGKYEVTQAQYLALIGSNPSYFQPPNASPDLDRPVEMVNWHDARSYCAVLSQQEQAAGRIAGNSVYRLPTEAEWEYACRAWISDRRFSYGDDPGYTNLTNYGWYFDNAGLTTHPVGQKLPNPWGLCDMGGNVSEWCLDWWSYNLPGGIVLDPQGPAAGQDRIYRGSNYAGNPATCRSAFRDGNYPGFHSAFVGFRVVLAPGQP